MLVSLCTGAASAQRPVRDKTPHDVGSPQPIRVSKLTAAELNGTGLSLRDGTVCYYNASGDSTAGYLFVLNATTRLCALKIDGKVTVLKDTINWRIKGMAIGYFFSGPYRLEITGRNFEALDIVLVDHRNWREKVFKVVGGCKP